MIDKNMDKVKRSFLFIVFGFSLVVSHYGLSYIYMFCLISAWLILVSGEDPRMQKLMSNFYSKFGRKIEEPAGNSVLLKADRMIGSNYVLLFIVFTLTWYMYVSSSSAFNTIVHIGDHIASGIFTDFLNPEAAQGLGILTKKTISPLHSVTKYLHLVSQFFISVGILTSLLKRVNTKFKREYSAFSLVNFAICFGGIALPYFASSLNTTRLYQITLIFLAPFCVIGGVTVFKMLSRVVEVSWADQCMRSSLRVLSVFLAIFLLFNSGWVYEVAKDHPRSISLSQEWIKECGGTKSKMSFYNCYIPEQDIFGAWWVSGNWNVTTTPKVYADYNSCCHVLQSYGGIKKCKIQMTNTTEIKQGYIYLGYMNLVNGIMSQQSASGPSTYNTSEISPILNKKSRIYSNGGSYVYR